MKLYVRVFANCAVYVVAYALVAVISRAAGALIYLGRRWPVVFEVLAAQGYATIERVDKLS